MMYSWRITQEYNWVWNPKNFGEIVFYTLRLLSNNNYYNNKNQKLI